MPLPIIAPKPIRIGELIFLYVSLSSDKTTPVLTISVRIPSAVNLFVANSQSLQVVARKSLAGKSDSVTILIYILS